MKPPTLLIAFLLAAASSAAEPIPPAAWQRGDTTLARKWELLTGKFIYQQACTSCHKWGPDYWPRSRWKEYLTEFPGNHEPDVRGTYKDLTAMFDVGRAVPTRKQEEDALAKFITASAPLRELPGASRQKAYEGFPSVGETAPDFAIADVQGKEFSLAKMRDKKAVVLVFSRAHW